MIGVAKNLKNCLEKPVLLYRRTNVILNAGEAHEKQNKSQQIRELGKVALCHKHSLFIDDLVKMVLK